MVTARDVAATSVARARARAQDPKDVWGIPTGFDYFDTKTHGIRNIPGDSELATLIARPQVGKTALAAKFARNIAKHFQANEPGKVVRLMLFEMSAEKFQDRIAAIEANVPLEAIETGRVSPAALDRFAQAHDVIAELPIEYLDQLSDMDQIARFIARDGTCGWWMLDHIGLVPGISGSSNNVSAFNLVSNRLKQATIKVAPGLVIAHQNRQSLAQPDKRPTEQSVAGGDSLMRDSDRLYGLYRPDLFQRLPDELADDPKPGELICIKNRHGPLFTDFLVYNPTRTDWMEDPTKNAKKRVTV